jgi:hypothetical protein
MVGLDLVLFDFFTNGGIPAMVFRVLLVFVAIFSQASEPATPTVSDRQQGIEWMLAQRIARENLTPERAAKLEETYSKLNDSQIRTLVLVYEESYGIRAPFKVENRPDVDPTQAQREWILAYKIVHERLSVEQAKEYGQMLQSMSPSQIRVLAQAYEEKEKQARTQHIKEQTEQEQADRQQAEDQMRAAAESKAFWNQQSQIELARAGKLRSQTERAQSSSNHASRSAAAQANRNLEQQRAFSERMYERGSGGYGGYTRGPGGGTYWRF